MPNRPAIPVEIQREIFLESGHRCAVCGTPLPLERAHIIPWHKSKEHKAENLICLCATCHERADQEHWGEKTLREYKKKPWVLRNYEKSNSPDLRTEVEFIINMELPQFDEKQKTWLQFALAGFLGISPNDIQIISVRKSNSVTVTIELPPESADRLLNAYKNEDTELLSCLAPFGLMSIRTAKVRKDYSSFFRLRTSISYAALFTAVLTFVFGVNIADYINVNIADYINYVFNIQNRNYTIIEGIIAVLNIVLASIVLVDTRRLLRIKTANDNTTASNTYKQLLFGWQWLWFTWILFYGCLVTQWLYRIDVTSSNFLWRVSDALNMINGFFFYYLFFVLDQPSVATDNEPYRAKSFRFNCAFTFLVGVILFDMSGLITLFMKSSSAQEGLLSKLVPAYIAVGMAFFFGRLDSHYLKLHRIILAPFYLYAIIQLFWGYKTFVGVSEFNPERVAIFSLALLLKFVLFINISTLIRHESFRRYLIIAEERLSKT